MHNLGDVYMLILWPDGVGKPDTYVLFTEDMRTAHFIYRTVGLMSTIAGGSRETRCARLWPAKLLPANVA